MRYLKKLCCVMMLSIMTMAAIPQESYAWRWPFRWPRRRPAARPRVRRPVSPKKYIYIRKHDLNKDGRVDVRDSLLWANRHKAGFATVVVTKDNADIYEAMDLNNDGKVTKAELDEFYYLYDLNRNGVLEESEIELATD